MASGGDSALKPEIEEVETLEGLRYKDATMEMIKEDQNQPKVYPNHSNDPDPHLSAPLRRTSKRTTKT